MTPLWQEVVGVARGRCRRSLWTPSWVLSLTRWSQTVSLDFKWFKCFVSLFNSHFFCLFLPLNLWLFISVFYVSVTESLSALTRLEHLMSCWSSDVGSAVLCRYVLCLSLSAAMLMRVESVTVETVWSVMCHCAAGAILSKLYKIPGKTQHTCLTSAHLSHLRTPVSPPHHSAYWLLAVTSLKHNQ